MCRYCCLLGGTSGLWKAQGYTCLIENERETWSKKLVDGGINSKEQCKAASPFSLFWGKSGLQGFWEALPLLPKPVGSHGTARNRREGRGVKPLLPVSQVVGGALCPLSPVPLGHHLCHSRIQDWPALSLGPLLHSDHCGKEEKLSPLLSGSQVFCKNVLDSMPSIAEVIWMGCAGQTPRRNVALWLWCPMGLEKQALLSPSSSTLPLEKRHAGAHLCPWVWGSHTPQLLPPLVAFLGDICLTHGSVH